MEAVEHSEHASKCLSCGCSAVEAFCPECGEPAVHAGDLRLRHLTHDFAHEFTHVDGKIWRTIRALLFEPGRLTAEYWAGRRGPWIRPIRIYLIVTALQLLLAANASGPMGLRVWAGRTKSGEQHFTVGQSGAATAGGSLVNQETNHRIQSVYLWVRYFGLAAFAGASLLVYRRSQPYFGAHMIFALHYYSFESIVSGLMLRVAPLASPLIPIGIGVLYLFLAQRRVYHQRWFQTVWKTVVLFAAVTVSEALILGVTVLAVLKLWPGAE